MPYQREQVDPGLRPPVIRPVSAPVDTFLHPTDGDKLSQLGQALTQIAPEVGRFTGAVVGRMDKNAEIEGRLAAEKIRQDGLSLAEATRKGEVPASRNPYYMAGLHEQLGRNQADKYEGDLRAAMGNDENLQNSTNIQDFDKFEQDFRKTWTKDNLVPDQDQHFNLGFQFKSDAAVNDVRNQFANGIEGKVQKFGDEATHQEVAGAIEHALSSGLPLTGATNALTHDINALANDLVQKQGRNGQAVMRTIAKAVAQTAIAHPEDSAKILKMMEEITGKNGTLSTTSYGMTLRDAAEREVASKLQEQYNFAETKQRVEKQAHEDDIFTRANDAFLKAGQNAYAVDIAPLQAEMNKVSPEHVATLGNMQQAFVAKPYKEDPAIADSLYVRMYTAKAGEADYVTAGTISAALHPGGISQSTFRSLMAELHERDKPERQVTADHFFTSIRPVVLSDIVNNAGDDQKNQIRANSLANQVEAAFIKKFAGKTGPEFDDAKNKFIAEMRGQYLDPQGTPKERNQLLQSPTLNSGPQKADFTQHVVVPKPTLNQLKSQQTEIQEGRRQRFDASLLRVLQANGVKLDPQHIVEFIVAQQALMDRGKTYPVDPNP